MIRVLFAFLVLAFIQGEASQNPGIHTAPSDPIPEGSIGIKMIRDGEYLVILVQDSSGKEEPLTFGNFISYSVNAILGKSVDYCTITQTQPIFVGYEIKNASLKSFIANAQGEKSPFTFSSFLDTLSNTLLNCQAYETANQPPNTSSILFQKSGGSIQTMIQNTKGKLVKLNLGNLLSISSQVFPNCTPSQNQDRIVQIVIDDATAPDLKVYQIDAYGKKEPFDLDNLATAVAETLENCVQDVSGTLATPLPNSLKIKFITTSAGETATYLVTKGDTVELNLGTLLAGAAEIVPFYQGKTDHILVTYKRDNTGAIKGTLTDLMGNQMELSLPNLVKAAALFPTIDRK